MSTQTTAIRRHKNYIEPYKQQKTPSLEGVFFYDTAFAVSVDAFADAGIFSTFILNKFLKFPLNAKKFYIYLYVLY